jgi:hypothetical protein
VESIDRRQDRIGISEAIAVAKTGTLIATRRSAWVKQPEVWMGERLGPDRLWCIGRGSLCLF